VSPRFILWASVTSDELKLRYKLLVGVAAVLLAAGGWVIWDNLPKAGSRGVEVIASGLSVPWAIDFTPNGDLYFTERGGRVSVIRGGSVQLLAEINVTTTSEGGLLGIALSPDFASTPDVYLYYTYQDATGVWNRVVRMREESGSLTPEVIVIDRIPGGSIHDGGRIKFGPDGKLYVTCGEAGSGSKAQDMGSLGGKLLRIHSDGSIPADNPFPGSPVWSLGHRNPQGLAWDEEGSLYEAEHGPSGENGNYAHDEINRVAFGSNYGWPSIIGYKTTSGLVAPVYSTESDTWAPSGCTFVTTDRYTGWRGGLLVACLRGRGVRLLQLNAAGDGVDSVTTMLTNYGRVREIVEGPDGYIYFTTSNRDGRGIPTADDDKILRIATVDGIG
jgi:glucose/arabinose dehydrogenase